jgi:hypothetical protein
LRRGASRFELQTMTALIPVMPRPCVGEPHASSYKR